MFVPIFGELGCFALYHTQKRRLTAIKETRGMVVPIPTEVIPVWYIEKWKKEEAENGSALEHFINQLIKDWRSEEARMAK